MDIFDTIIKRGSTRQFGKEQVSDEKLSRIVEAGEMAPIASKDYKKMMITVIQDTMLLEEIGRTVGTYLGKASINPL